MPTVNMEVLEESRRHQVVQEYEVYPLNTSDVDDYQIEVTGMASNIKNDARILQNNFLDQWAESKGNVWSKLDNLKAKTPQIVLGLSGNPSSENIDDGNATFLLFDDFTGLSLNAASTSGDITVSADSGKYEAWPGIAKAANGDLFVVYRTSDTNTHGFDNTGKVVIRKSTDDGQSWGSEVVVANDAGVDDRNAGILIFDNGGTETILVVYNTLDGVGGNNVAYCKKSTDGGLNWGSKINLSSGNDRGTGGMVPILLSNDKILVPISSATNTYVVESTDGGDNWTEYLVADFGTEFNIIETKTGGSYTGGIYGLLRDDSVPRVYKKTTSTDYGHTWSAYSDESDFSDPYATPITMIRASNGELLAVYTKDTGDLLELYESTDEGANWTYKKTLVSGASISYYPVMELIGSTELIVAWCVNGATSDVYVNFIDYPITAYKWNSLTQGTATITQTGGEVVLALPVTQNNYAVLQSVDTYGIGHRLKTKFKARRGIYRMYSSLGFNCYLDPYTHTDLVGETDTSGAAGNRYIYGTAVDGGNWDFGDIATHNPDDDTFYNFEVLRYVGGSKIYWNETLMHTPITEVPNDIMPIEIGVGTYSTGAAASATDSYIDWAFVGKYTVNEPIIQNISKLNRASLIKHLGSRL